MTYRRVIYDQPPTAGSVRVSRGQQTIELPYDSTPETWECHLARLGDEYEVFVLEHSTVLGWPGSCEPLTVSRNEDLMSGGLPCNVRLE